MVIMSIHVIALVIDYASGNSSDQEVRNVVRMRTQEVRTMCKIMGETV